MFDILNLSLYPDPMVEDTHIRVLPTHVANKIAAGEVVDRPASVAKELIENSFDAEATQVDVEVSAGGRKLVTVSDNGVGMGRDDALLSVERQATSKIRDVDDIEHIATLGFRGEALAAIASVARFRLVTCRREDDAGTEVTITGGKLQDVREIGAPAGTRIEVRDLFFNVPARRKFLRTYQTELGHIRSGFITQALAHPGVGMSLKVDGRETYRLAAGSDISDRVREIFGPDYHRDLRSLEGAGPEVTVRGFVGLPTVHRGDRGEQYCFVNGRAASAPLLNYAIREGYRSLLPSDRHPCVFLFITLDPAMVDVNVHPAKKEIRFRRPSETRDAVIAAIRKALALPPCSDTALDDQSSPILPGDPGRPVAETQMKIADLIQTRTFRYPRMGPGMSPAPASGSDKGQGREAESTASEPGLGSSRTVLETAPWSWCRVLGQVKDFYVVMETEDGLVLMDPRSSHERVLFEQLMAEVTQGDVEVQNLLIPETVELKPRDADRLRKNLAVLKTMGFGVSEFGGDTFVVDALPACVKEASAKEMLIGLPQTLEEAGSRGAKGQWREEAIAQAACQEAVRARDKLTLEEIEELIVALSKTEMPYTSPKGRPTIVFTSMNELNRKFGRE
ncbi:MAG: DNA mismatch repair endonuclease MutL [Kiritimatiellia bacterium]|nr:DNA mismatch repair endonuclease MutL [Kiritimatiellia bacterium]MDP6847864.1 DNA mismatch repair endonuclease MutL [Kiritimatiellia bacterium]